MAKRWKFLRTDRWFRRHGVTQSQRSVRRRRPKDKGREPVGGCFHSPSGFHHANGQGRSCPATQHRPGNRWSLFRNGEFTTARPGRGRPAIRPSWVSGHHAKWPRWLSARDPRRPCPCSLAHRDGGWAMYIHQPFGTFDFSGPQSKFIPAGADSALPLDIFLVASRDPNNHGRIRSPHGPR